MKTERPNPETLFIYINIVCNLRVKHATPQYLHNKKSNILQLIVFLMKTERPNPDGHFLFISILFVICVCSVQHHSIYNKNNFNKLYLILFLRFL